LVLAWVSSITDLVVVVFIGHVVMTVLHL